MRRGRSMKRLEEAEIDGLGLSHARERRPCSGRLVVYWRLILAGDRGTMMGYDLLAWHYRFGKYGGGDYAGNSGVA